LQPSARGGILSAMPVYVALLRAVNVGGTGKLPMADLVSMAQAAGFQRVRTYIASGNLVFESPDNEKHVKALIEQALAAYAGKHVDVLVRTAEEMAAVLDGNPFPDKPPNRTVVIFLDDPPPPDTLALVVAPDGEEVRIGTRELFVSYGDSMGRSKLKIPAARSGTARNINTVARLAAMANA
jgi:uncharacterized protein (DUF1697 family)